jgi:hypothetical protein
VAIVKVQSLPAVPAQYDKRLHCSGRRPTDGRTRSA